MRFFSSVNQQEIDKFARLSHHWYNSQGEYLILRNMNPVRISFIRQFYPNTLYPFKNMNLLDIGCGGGFLSESLCRLGGNVDGVDAVKENISVAKQHAIESNLNINYIHSTAEDLNGEFDAIFCMELLEHVNDPAQFVGTLSNLLKKDSYIFFSTINRSVWSYLSTILLAEHVLRWVPKGTHSIEKYISPQELESFCNNAGLKVVKSQGMHLNPITKEWSLSSKSMLLANYIMACKKV